MNHLENRSILFLCEYCFEGFDNALNLITHKISHNTASTAGTGATSEKPLPLPLTLPFRRKDGLTTDAIGTQLPVPGTLENIDVSSTWSLQHGVSRTVYQNRSGDDVEYPCTLPETIISEEIHRKTKIRQTSELSNPAVQTRQLQRGGQQLRAPNFAQGSLRVETAVCSITDSNSNLDQLIHTKSSSNSYKQRHNPAIYTQKKRNKNKSGIRIAQEFPRQHPSPPKKQLQCQYCKKTGFGHITQVINHERIHTGERPFTCSHCKTSFTWKNSLASHLAKNKRCRYPQKNENSDFQHTIIPLLQEEQQQQLHSLITSCNENISTVSTDLPYNCHYCGECYVSASESALHFKKSVTCAMLREQSLTSKIPSSPPYRSTINFKNQSKSNSSSASVGGAFRNATVDTTTTPKADVDCNPPLDNFQKHEKPFQCSQCDRTFSLKRFLVNHERSHRRSGTGRPRRVSKSNSKLKIGLTHLKNNYHIKPSIATLSLKQIQLQSALNEIKTSSTETEPESIYVNREFINGRAYYCCNLCNYKYSSKYHAFNHVRSHTGNTPFKCIICKAEFTTKQLLSLHKKKNHRRRGRRPLSPSKLKAKGRSSDLHTCHICNKSYKFKSLLHLHLRTCSRSEATAGKLQNLIEADTTPNATVISSSTVTMKSLQSLKISNKQQNYSLLNHTTRHLIAETGKTIFVCNFCKKSFANSWYATHHVKLHTGEVSHKCDDCGKGFSLETSLNSHRLKYHIPTESPFNCSVCGNGFTTENKLNSHLVKCLCGFEVERWDTDASPLAGIENENNGANIEIGSERNGSQYSPSDNNDDELDFGQSPTDDELEFGDGESAESNSDHEKERPNFLSDTSRNSFSYRNKRYCQYCGDRVTRNQYDGHVKRCELNTRSPNIV